MKEYHSHLLALSLSVSATAQIRSIQRSLFKTSEDIRALAVTPLIPLLWSKEIPSLPTFPLMVSPVTFDTPMCESNHLYLVSQDEKWLSLCEMITHNIQIQKESDALFPHSCGIYLGTSSSSSLSFECANDDWRVVLLELYWHVEGEKVVHIRSKELANKHLL